MHPLRSHLEAVGAALLNPKMHNRALGDWDNQSDGPTVSIGPPVSSAEIGRLEKQTGHKFPSTLTEVLTQVSGNIELSWSTPAKQVKTSWGFEVEPLFLPPAQFCETVQRLGPDGKPPLVTQQYPKQLSGGLIFGIDGVLRALDGFPFNGLYDEALDGDDPERIEHCKFIEAFMGFGLPVMTAPNGDWLAIDLRDNTQRLLHVSHEGDEAGIELDLTLPQFLTHLSWLGPIWPDFMEIHEFSTETKELIPGDYRINAARFDAEGEHGTAWRAWFWQDAPPPRPDESLLKRV